MRKRGPTATPAAGRQSGNASVALGAAPPNTPQAVASDAAPGGAEANPSPTEGRVGQGTARDLLLKVAAGLANVTVITALLAYFGWQRSEIQARELGIDESILGMTTGDYILRSVQSILVLILVVATNGLLWLSFNGWLMRRLRTHGRADFSVRWASRLLLLAWLAVPIAVWAIGYLWQVAAFIAWPFSIGGGMLLTLYGIHLRSKLPGADKLNPGNELLARIFAALVVLATLFWGASNVATVQGVNLATDFAEHLDEQVQVIAYSSQRLYLTAPGVVEKPLTASDGAFRYRYQGLRLLDHIGGRYFFISDGWSPGGARTTA
jgi:hypothetical protein